MESLTFNVAGLNILISQCDYEKVIKHKWYKINSGKKYPTIAFYERNKNIRLHRFIMDCPSGLFIDHVNGNTLDNRRENLRICTKAENNRNRCINKNNKSGFKGVSWDKKTSKWRAFVYKNGKSIYCGLFITPEEAHKAYYEASKKYYGEFVRAE